MPRIAIIDNAIDPDFYRPVRHWSRWLAGDWVAFEARNGRLPSLDDGFSHILLTGSEASILERPPWVEAEVALVREALARGLSILGSCYGHQLLAVAIGGPRYVRRCREPEIGWLPIGILKDDPLLGPARTAHAFTHPFRRGRRPGRAPDRTGRDAGLSHPGLPVTARSPSGASRPIPRSAPDDGRELLEAELERGTRGGADRKGPALRAPGRRAHPVDRGGVRPDREINGPFFS